MAFLLGHKEGSKVSRYERFLREPGLETALAYQAITGVPVHELFAGMYRKIEREVEKRKELLIKDTGHGPGGSPVSEANLKDHEMSE